jgi:hypothetical protein
VFHIHCGYEVWKSSLSKWARVGAITQNGLPVRDSSSWSGFTEVIAIQ